MQCLANGVRYRHPRMQRPTSTPQEEQIKRDGRLLIRLMKLIAVVRLPDEVLVQGDRPTLAAGNHRSLLDIFCAAACCASADVSCRFLVQASYFKNPLAGRWLRRIGCIPLNSETKEAAFEEAAAALERGELIGIMPEGRLVKPEERDPQTGPAHLGIAELAERTNARIRPVVFHHTDLAWPRGGKPRLSMRRPVVTVEIRNEDLELPDASYREQADHVMAYLTERLDALDADEST